MAYARTVAAGLGALALAQLIVASQLTINQGITHALSHALAAWERARDALHPPPPAPVPPVAREPAPAPRWTWVAADGAPTSAPAVAPDGHLYVSTRDALVALAPDGRERWRVAAEPTAPFLGAPIATAHGDVAVARFGAVTVHDRDGRPRWTHTTDEPRSTRVHLLTPARDGGLWFVAERMGALPGPAAIVALDADGGTRWTVPLGAHRPTTLVPLADATLLVDLADGLLRLAPDGTRTRDALTGHPSPAPDGDVHLVDATSFSILTPAGAVRSTTHLAGDRPLCNDSGTAVGPDGAVAFACGERLYVIGGGVLRWSATVGARVGAPPAFAPDGTLYAGADGVYAFDAAGHRLWHAPTIFAWRAAPTPRAEAVAVTAGPLIGPDGTIYAGSQRNRVYAFRPDGTARWILPLGDDDTLVWRVERLTFLDDTLLIASHGLVALPVEGARQAAAERGS